MNLRLEKPDLERYIDEQVKAGNFPTPEAVVEDALMRAMEEEDVELTAEDRENIARSKEEIKRGEVVDYDDFAARMRKKYGTQ